MISRVFADESLQVLVFICAPLVVLLILFIVLMRKYSHTTAKCPNYSVTVLRIGPVDACVLYRSGNLKLEFPAQIRKGKRLLTPLIYVRVPGELPDEDAHKIVPNVASGLTVLHYDYLIFRNSETPTIPDEEREAAIAELHQMGVEVEGTVGNGQVSRAVIHNLRESSTEQTKATIAKVQSLMGKASGLRESIQVLARSNFDGAG